MNEYDRQTFRTRPNAKTIFATTCICATLLLGIPAWAFYNPSTGRWLSRDPLASPPPEMLDWADTGNADKEGLYAFVRNNPASGKDPRGLAYYCETATVQIFADPAQPSFNVEETLAELRLVTPAPTGIYWKIVREKVPPGSQLGFQGSIWPGTSCQCLYYLQANVLPSTIRVVQGTVPLFDILGHGRGWVADAFPDQFKWNYEDDNAYLPPNWQDRNSADGWQQMSGFIMAHEIVHAVGARHVRKHGNIMDPHMRWKWLNATTVPVDPSTMLRVESNLLQWHPGTGN